MTSDGDSGGNAGDFCLRNSRIESRLDAGSSDGLRGGPQFLPGECQ
jgi:hypothetical protein